MNECFLPLKILLPFQSDSQKTSVISFVFCTELLCSYFQKLAAILSTTKKKRYIFSLVFVSIYFVHNIWCSCWIIQKAPYKLSLLLLILSLEVWTDYPFSHPHPSEHPVQMILNHHCVLLHPNHFNFVRLNLIFLNLMALILLLGFFMLSNFSPIMRPQMSIT